MINAIIIAKIYKYLKDDIEKAMLMQALD